MTGDARRNDVGGREPWGPIDRSEHELEDWEICIDAIENALEADGVMAADELRRAIEDLPEDVYRDLTYYQRWVAALETIIVERGWASREELDRLASEAAAAWGEA
jgi:hypothetical protein